MVLWAAFCCVGGRFHTAQHVVLSLEATIRAHLSKVSRCSQDRNTQLRFLKGYLEHTWSSYAIGCLAREWSNLTLISQGYFG